MSRFNDRFGTVPRGELADDGGGRLRVDESMLAPAGRRGRHATHARVVGGFAAAMVLAGLAACSPGSHTTVTPASGVTSATIAPTVAAPASAALASGASVASTPASTAVAAATSAAAVQSSALAQVKSDLARLNSAAGQASTDLSAGDSARAQPDNG